MDLPAFERSLHLGPIAFKRQLSFAVFIDLVHDKIQRFAPIGQAFGESEVIFRLHMVVVHDVQHRIRQMQRRMRRLLVAVVRRIHSGRIHEHAALAQQRNPVPHLDGGIRAAIGAVCV